ncbi:MAG: ABC transporter ATP-binding protein [Chloroflexota bacterium]|nr:ABC transporter ATP-binding protein [Chloroflexota bacterium]
MTDVANADVKAESVLRAADVGRPVLDARNVSQRFGRKTVLSDVSLSIRAGEIHALLGPNGAGKTTLIRILAGLQHPTAGSVEIAGFRPSANARLFRQQIGFVASGDRTFYLRISGLENLVFFARLHGMTRRQAIRRGEEVLADVGLDDAGRTPVSAYSHGMQKRLAVARALLTSPPVMLIDEATHDLDPDAARRVRELVAMAASRGAAVAWVTQRLEEIRGFADEVTLLHAGGVRFSGTVPQLMAHAAPRRYLLHLEYDRGGAGVLTSVRAALASKATLTQIGEEESGHYALLLASGVVLGDALGSLAAGGIRLLSCQEERSEIEEAFLLLVEEHDT